MKQIISREETEKKERRNKIIIGLILVGIMVISSAGYAFFGTDKTSAEKIQYNNIEFSLQDDNLWHAKIQDYEFSAFYNPKDTENISGIVTLKLGNYYNKPLFFSYDSDRQAVEEISRNIASFTQRVQYVCLDECKEDFPVKNCTDNIIIIKDLNISLIKQEDNCVYILADRDNILRASDAFVYKILGVQ